MARVVMELACFEYDSDSVVLVVVWMALRVEKLFCFVFEEKINRLDDV